MRAGVEVDGAAEVARNMERLADRFGRAIAEAAVEGGRAVEADAIRSIQQKSPGREVTRYREGGGEYQHIAASEGQAPNTDTGRLVSSIQVEIERRAVFVGSTLEYAGYLEHGTRQMRARPWLNPALEGRRRWIADRIRQATDRVSRRHGDV